MYGLRFDAAQPSVQSIEQKVISLVPPDLSYEFHVTSTVLAQVELAIKPESVALGAFGAIAALVCLSLAAQGISRLLRFGEEDQQVLRALGPSTAVTVADALVGSLLPWHSLRCLRLCSPSPCHRSDQ
jgi:hypothetical protein